MVKPSDVERITRNISERKENPDFYVSHSTLADIENGSVPSIHKLFSLSVCLRISLEELLFPFGIDPAEISPTQTESEADSLVQGVHLGDPPFRFQLNFDVNHSNRETNLLRLPAQDLEHLPSFFRASRDPVRYRYAVIGSEDDSMSDFLPPKSLVEIDTAQNNVEVFQWHTLRDRPVYLVWHTEGHSCCWCQVDGRELTILPHPLSRQPVRRFRMPGQASVVGRVINAWLSFGPGQLQPRNA
ncbi:MAG TPA: helix-turn-helix transcriptional regulator [Terracidiphilus sp.]|jgi:transcriptional regulator with XRE-family HTH domain